MRAVVQRVSRASVAVDGREVGAISRGLAVLVGIEAADTPADVAWMAEKVTGLRIFEDAAEKMNLSVKDLLSAGRTPATPSQTPATPSRTPTQPAILLVPNFTIAGDARKGRRPGFDNAMRPEAAEPMFDALVEAVRRQGVPVERGAFRVHMTVTILNDGPVTIWLDSRA